MRKKIIGSTILTVALSSVLIIPSLGQTTQVTPISAEDAKIIPISYRMHWSQVFIDQLSKDYNVESIFSEKDLNTAIKAEDYQNIVRMVLDAEYNGTPDAMTREAVVYELMKIWADKTGQNLDEIATIRMIIYSDTEKIDPKYNHAITVAYMRDVAKGRGEGIFAPKSDVTYGELAALIFNTAEAIEKENQPDVQPIDEEKFETRGSYEITDGKVVFDFELVSYYTNPKELLFGSGQQFELVITDEKEEEVYRFSEGKFFTLAIVPKTINPGEALKWQDEWDMTDKEGNKLTAGKYKAKIDIMVIPEENSEKIEESQLTTVIEFELTDIEGKKEIIKSKEAEEIIKGTADKLIDAIKDKDFETVSELAHPIKGVRFTPYTYVSLEDDMVFNKEDIKNFFNDEKVYVWGIYDGIGDDISLTPGKYYERFIYSADFKNANEIGYNKVLSTGNMLENQFEVYDNPIIVEYYFPGFNPEYEGMDWKSLRLVFEQYEDNWYLVGIIHNQWTI